MRNIKNVCHHRKTHLYGYEAQYIQAFIAIPFLYGESAAKGSINVAITKRA
jgi:hypothetical protein